MLFMPCTTIVLRLTRRGSPLRRVFPMLPTAVSVACTMPTASPDVPEMIVIVDDDPLMRRTMAANLEDAGYRTTSFDGAQTVLQYFSGGGLPAAALLHWPLPDAPWPLAPRPLPPNGPQAPCIFLPAP